MARGVNKVILIGNLGKDPEVKVSQGGVAYGNLRVATTESRKDKDANQWKDHTEWHQVVVLGRVADVAQQYLKKGAHVYIEGRLQTRKYTDKSGIERYTTEIVANEMQMLGEKKGGSSVPEEGYFGPGSEQVGGGGGSLSHEEYDDIPF